MAFARTKRFSLAAADWLARPRVARTSLVLLFLALAVWQLATAWVAEDGFITFRVLDNAVHGYGLRWNIDERVQVYTHPLWMLIQLPFYAITHDAFYNCIALSFVLTMATFALIWRRYWRHGLLAVMVVALPLLLSRALREYSISGLENPLTDLLLVMFYLWFFRRGPVAWFRLSLTAGLLLMTRFDALWLIAPAGLYLLVTQWRHIPWMRSIAGMLPLAAWCLFSLLYYGFVFPNTKYAKLNTGIALSDNLRQSVHYYIDYFRNDMPDCAVLLIVLGCLAWRFWHRRQIDKWACGAFGIVAYLAYLCAIGGDYMSGRFFTAPFLLAVLLLADHAQPQPRAWSLALAPVLTIALMIGSHYTTLDIVSMEGIANERFFYRQTNTLTRNFPGTDALMSNPWAENGLELRAQAEALLAGAPPTVEVRTNAGMTPFYAGPQVRFLDPFGLADPLLARLPIPDRNAWRIGHFFRLLPTGYHEFRRTGDLSGMNPDLASYTGALFEIIRAPVWDAHRLRTLRAFYLGHFDTARDRYVEAEIYRHRWPMARLDHERDVEMPTLGGYYNADPINFVVASGEIFSFEAEQPVRAATLRTSFLGDCAFHYRFFRGDTSLGEVSAARGQSGFSADRYGLVRGSVPLPQAVRKGFTRFELSAATPHRQTCGAALPPLIYYTSFH